MFPGVLVSDAMTGQAVSVTRLRQSADSLMTLVPYRQGMQEVGGLPGLRL